jgi:hypothetical protein
VRHRHPHQHQGRPDLDWIVVAGMTALAVAWHVWCLRRLAPRRALGDELDYLRRGHWQDPHLPELFLRVPLMPAISRWATLASPHPEAALRLLFTILGAAAATMVLLAGQRLGGSAVGTLALLFMLLMFERVLLSSHVWPDTLLSALHATAILLLTLPPTLPVLLALGLVAMLATLARIEQLALAVGIVALLAWRDPSQLALASACVIAPTTVALALCALRAWRRYGIALPDTTWLFNLRILERQLEVPGTGPMRIEGSIRALLNADAPTTTRHRELLRMVLRPFALAGSALRRLVACFGPDTFVSGKLVPPLGAGYPDMSATTAGYVAVALRWPFPLLAATTAWAMLATRHIPDYLIVALAVLLALVLVHFRSRYRLVLMPWLCLAAAETLQRVELQALGLADGMMAALLLALVWLHARHPLLVEHEGQVRAS